MTFRKCFQDKEMIKETTDKRVMLFFPKCYGVSSTLDHSMINLSRPLVEMIIGSIWIPPTKQELIKHQSGALFRLQGCVSHMCVSLNVWVFLQLEIIPFYIDICKKAIPKLNLLTNQAFLLSYCP